MSTTERPLLVVGDRFARTLPELGTPWSADVPPSAELVALDEDLATELGLDPEALRTDAGIAALLGQGLGSAATPVAQVYAGHQFGGWSPRLGDGRALLLGELVQPDGTLVDVHLKGSGRTPFARGGDGKAVLGPMLREVVISRAMHRLGIPTTRSLAVIATGELVRRETPQPGAVLVRVAASHLRVGTFQYAASTQDLDLLRRLADHVVERHHPHVADVPEDRRYLALFESVVETQAALVARWMHVGFVHGVMNTDNTTLSGETIDYGPCAFMDAFDPATVFSSIDHGGRYAYGNQPRVLQWNLARLAEAMLPLFGLDADGQVPPETVEEATAILRSFDDRYRRHWESGLRAKLGLTTVQPGDAALFDDLVAQKAALRVDHTRSTTAYANSVFLFPQDSYRSPNNKLK